MLNIKSLFMYEFILIFNTIKKSQEIKWNKSNLENLRLMLTCSATKKSIISSKINTKTSHASIFSVIWRRTLSIALFYQGILDIDLMVHLQYLLELLIF